MSEETDMKSRGCKGFRKNVGFDFVKGMRWNME